MGTLCTRGNVNDVAEVERLIWKVMESLPFLQPAYNGRAYVVKDKFKLGFCQETAFKKCL